MHTSAIVAIGAFVDVIAMLALPGGVFQTCALYAATSGETGWAGTAPETGIEIRTLGTRIAWFRQIALKTNKEAS